MVEVLRDVLDNLDELIVAVVAASSGGFIGGWMALRAARTSIDRSVQASKDERREAEVEHRRLTLVALEAELRLNAALLASERSDGSLVAPAWRIPFRDAYVSALPYLSGLPPGVQRALQETAVLSSHYTVMAERHNARVATVPEQQGTTAFLQASHDRLAAMAPDVGDRYLRTAAELGDYLNSAAASASGGAA